MQSHGIVHDCHIQDRKIDRITHSDGVRDRGHVVRVMRLHSERAIHAVPGVNTASVNLAGMRDRDVQGHGVRGRRPASRRLRIQYRDAGGAYRGHVVRLVRLPRRVCFESGTAGVVDVSVNLATGKATIRYTAGHDPLHGRYGVAACIERCRARGRIRAVCRYGLPRSGCAAWKAGRSAHLASMATMRLKAVNSTPQRRAL